MSHLRFEASRRLACSCFIFVFFSFLGRVPVVGSPLGRGAPVVALCSGGLPPVLWAFPPPCPCGLPRALGRLGLLWAASWLSGLVAPHFWPGRLGPRGAGPPSPRPHLRPLPSLCRLLPLVVSAGSWAPLSVLTRLAVSAGFLWECCRSEPGVGRVPTSD